MKLTDIDLVLRKLLGRSNKDNIIRHIEIISIPEMISIPIDYAKFGNSYFGPFTVRLEMSLYESELEKINELVEKYLNKNKGE